MAFFLQVALTLIGVALLPTFGTSAPILITCWILGGVGLLVVGISVYRSRRRLPIDQLPQQEALLRRHLLHLGGELTTIEKTVDSAITSGHWWDVRFSGLPSHEWGEARDVVAEGLYRALVTLYAEADQLNKAANASAAENGPASILDPPTRQRLKSFQSDLETVRGTIEHKAAGAAPPFRHPYRTLTAAVAITAAATLASAIFAPSLWDSAPDAPPNVSNPLPNAGFPHGTGISHSDYPDGFRVDNSPTPTFNSYLDNEDGSPNDERSFLAARVLRPVRAPASGLNVGVLHVRPGDTVEVSIYIRNDADPAGNQTGRGPGVARNTRVLAGWNRRRARILSIGSYIWAENAIPDLAHPDLRTISANLELRSETQQPIRLEYVSDSAQYLQNAPASIGRHLPGRPIGRYKVWNLDEAQQRMLFTGYTFGVHENAEMDAPSGLPLGSDDGYRSRTLLGDDLRDRLNFYGGSAYFGYLTYRVRVLASPT